MAGTCMLAYFSFHNCTGLATSPALAWTEAVWCFWISAIGFVLSHFQAHVRNVEFTSRHHSLTTGTSDASGGAAAKAGRGSITRQEEEQEKEEQEQKDDDGNGDAQQQHDWEMLLEYCRDHIGGGADVGYGGLVAAALASAVILCDTGWNRHMLAFKVLLLSPLLLVACDRFVVSCSGRFARRAVHSLLCACTTLFSVSAFWSALSLGQQHQAAHGGTFVRPERELLEFLLIFLPMAVLMLGKAFLLPPEWHLKSFASSGCLCLAGWVNTASPSHLAGHVQLSDASRTVMLVRFWLEKPCMWYWVAFSCYVSTLGRERAPQAGQAQAQAQAQAPGKKKQLPFFLVEGLPVVATVSSSTYYSIAAFFAACFFLWNLDRPFEGWLFFFVDAIGPAFSIPLMLACFTEY
jgi:hypothetical protein